MKRTITKHQFYRDALGKEDLRINLVPEEANRGIWAFLVLFGVIYLFPFKTFAQTASEIDTVRADKKSAWVELSGFASTTNRTPFWLQANQWGSVPVSGQALRLDLDLSPAVRLCES